MAKIILFQYFWMEQLGIMHISSLLKKRGHSCKVAIGKKRDIIKKVKKFSPDIVGFTCFTGQQRWANEIFKGIKEINRSTLTIMGGPHATFFPEVIKELDSIDIVCRGEGEYPLLDLAEAVDNKLPYANINNLWVKKDSSIMRNEVRFSIDNIDSLPFPDRELYKEYPFIYKDTIKHTLTSRGCLFSCTYCFNNSADKLYRDKGGYCRLRSIENVINELKETKKNYKVSNFYFRDGNFINNKRWLLEFLDRYEKEIKTSYYCHFVASLLDEDIVKRLKSSGCYMTAFGVEAGNEEYRINVLKKRVTNRHIEDASRLLHKYKIPFYTTNMLGLPGESLSKAIETIKLNLKIKPFSGWYSMFVPYPRTELAEYAYKGNYLEKKDITLDKADSYKRSCLKHPDMQYIENLHKFTFILHIFPKAFSIVLKFVRLPYNIFYEILFNITYLLIFVRKSRKWTLTRFLEEALVATRYYR